MTDASPPHHALTWLINPLLQCAAPYGAVQAGILNTEALEAARSVISRWPGYATTPLFELKSLASANQVSAIHYKDESTRFGLGSFKALGGAYAVARLLCQQASTALGRTVTPDDLLRDPQVQALCRTMTVTCATDGNHGRSVAWGAQQLGCRCVVYIHATVSEGRRAAIAHFGAEVQRTQGNYDDAVQQADRDARAHDWLVISDTSYPGYLDVPRDVMQGYQLMVEEAVQALPKWPTHVFVQAGVGGLAAAVGAYFWERASTAQPAPRLVVVEPDNAACLLASARAGQVVAVKGELDTLMAGLACGEVSLLAWDILAPATSVFCSLPDAAAVDAMRLLAHPMPGDAPIVAGESAVAGLAAALLALHNDDARQALALGEHSRLLFFGSEGDTDPALYQQIVGRTAQQVRAQANSQAGTSTSWS